MRLLLAMALLVSSVVALSWQSFVTWPLEDKFLFQSERLKQIENGSFTNPYITANEARIWRQGFTSSLEIFRSNYPDRYSSSVGRVRQHIANVSIVTVAQETRLIKVGDHYVSESVCKAYPKACEAPPVVVQPQAPKIVNKRTAAQCSAAREKDWEVYCWQNAMVISCDAVSSVDKTMVLDNLADGYYSNQAICLRGE